VVGTLAHMLTDELISRRPSGRAGLADWYDEVFQAQRAEGLSAADLATLLNVTPTNIYYWKRRLRDLGAGEPGKERENAAAGLVRVKVLPRAEEPSAVDERKDLEIRLPNSRSVLVPRGFDPADLRQLITTLEAC